MSHDHEFQSDKPLDVMHPGLFRRIRRDLPQKAISKYQGVGGPGANAQDEFMQALRRQSDFHQLVLGYDTPQVLILPATPRTYLLIQNLDPAADLYLGFDFQPAINKGLRLIPGAFYEPFQVPQNDIWAAGSAAGTLTVIYAN